MTQEQIIDKWRLAMTNDNHPLTPPDELVKEWKSDYYPCPGEMLGDFERYIATQSARWGYEQRGADIEAKLQKARDEELEACCEYIAGPGKWFVNHEYRVADLRAARRPEPPSLAEEALEALNEADQGLNESEWRPRSNTIRRALERLQALEGEQSPRS